MNNSFKLAVAAIGICCVAPAYAAIETPTAISKTADMDFGRIAQSKRTVVKKATAARFAVSGLPFVTYAITLPGSATIADDQSNNMEIGSFISSPASSGTLDALGTQTLNVTGILNVPAKQPAGNYHNIADVEVTINFN